MASQWQEIDSSDDDEEEEEPLVRSNNKKRIQKVILDQDDEKENTPSINYSFQLPSQSDSGSDSSCSELEHDPAAAAAASHSKQPLGSSLDALQAAPEDSDDSDFEHAFLFRPFATRQQHVQQAGSAARSITATNQPLNLPHPEVVDLCDDEQEQTPTNNIYVAGTSASATTRQELNDAEHVSNQDDISDSDNDQPPLSFLQNYAQSITVIDMIGSRTQSPQGRRRQSWHPPTTPTVSSAYHNHPSAAALSDWKVQSLTRRRRLREATNMHVIRSAVTSTTATRTRTTTKVPPPVCDPLSHAHMTRHTAAAPPPLREPHSNHFALPRPRILPTPTTAQPQPHQVSNNLWMRQPVPQQGAIWDPTSTRNDLAASRPDMFVVESVKNNATATTTSKKSSRSQKQTSKPTTAAKKTKATTKRKTTTTSQKTASKKTFRRGKNSYTSSRRGRRGGGGGATKKASSTTAANYAADPWSTGYQHRTESVAQRRDADLQHVGGAAISF